MKKSIKELEDLGTVLDSEAIASLKGGNGIIVVIEDISG